MPNLEKPRDLGAAKRTLQDHVMDSKLRSPRRVLEVVQEVPLNLSISPTVNLLLPFGYASKPLSQVAQFAKPQVLGVRRDCHYTIN